MAEEKFEIYNLKKNKEIQFVIEDPKIVSSIELLSGNGEIFGAEMISNKICSFSSSFAVTTRSSCSLKVKGRGYSSFLRSYNPLINDIHRSLEEKRLTAEKFDSAAPVVLIVGPMDVGKSTLTRSLLNHAVCAQRKPLFIDLDVGQSSLSIPGSLGILPINKQSEIEGFNDAEASIYFFGYKSPAFNMPLYCKLIQRLGESVQWWLKNSRDVRTSGIFIDTCGWVESDGYTSILTAARYLNVDLLLVLSDKNVYHRLKRDLPAQLDIKLIPKLSGVTRRSKTSRIHKRNSLIYSYFYGTQNYPISPFTFEVTFSSLQIFRATVKASDDLPRYSSLELVPFSHELNNQVLALSHAQNADNAMTTSVFGFICMRQVDVDNQVVTVLSPQPGPLPTHILIVGDIELVDIQE